MSVLPHGSKPATIRAAGTRKTEKRIRVEIQGRLCPKEGKDLFSLFFYYKAPNCKTAKFTIFTNFVKISKNVEIMKSAKLY